MERNDTPCYSDDRISLYGGDALAGLARARAVVDAELARSRNAYQEDA